MPPPVIPKPQFNPLGRYLIDVRQRRDLTTSNYFHDTQNFKEECGIDQIPSGSQSRFNNREWALKRGYNPCGLCQN